jgi:O-antigen/teichoic acid export membrane protein
MTLVYGAGYAAGAEVLAILSVARLFAVATGSSGVAMTMTGHQKTMMYITLSTGVLSLGLELAMVKPFGIVGVAVATCIAQILQNLLQLFYTKKRLGIWTHVEFSFRPVLELVGR